MIWRKSKDTEEGGEEMQSSRGCWRGKAKLQRMLSWKSNITENVREETKVTKDVREEK